MDQFNFNSFPDTNFNEVNLSWMLEVMTQFKEGLESGQFVGPQGPQGDPGPAGDGITEEVKQALLQLARKVAYIDDQGETYYQDLYNALYGTTPAELVSISAAYTQSGTVYDTDSLDSLKADLIVTAAYSDSSTAVIPAADYTLSGSLTAGTSTITVSYSGKTATFQVTVMASAVTLVSISAAFNQGSAVIYESDSLDSLKQYLTVTATYSDSSTAVIPSTDYTLSGTLTEGTSTITVSYQGKTATFGVVVSHAARDTTAEIDEAGKIFIHLTSGEEYQTVNATNCGTTIKYTLDNPTTVLFPAGVIPTDARATMKYATSYACLFIYNENDEPVNFVNELTGSAFRWAQLYGETMTEFSNSYTVAEYAKIAFSVDSRYLDDAYMYDKATGQVWFAGINTPYYGMSNISEAGGN